MQSICPMEAQASRTGPVEEETTLIGLTFGGYLLSKVVQDFLSSAKDIQDISYKNKFCSINPCCYNTLVRTVPFYLRSQ